jgi:two-component system C4-dicarboxylate transport sensor histidine kinase DctB
VEPLALDALLATVRLLANGGLLASGIELVVAVAPACPPVMANRIGLQQVLVNLINNARDAICARPGDGCICIAAGAGGGLVRLTVRDNGGGVPEEALSQVFDSFYTLKAEGQGTGLGLPICKMLVESFGGTIAISNAEDGAEVTVQLAGA